MSDKPRLSEDQRYEIASGASASERRNRPTMLVIVPGLLLALAFVLLLVAWGRVSDADNERQRQRSFLQQSQQLSAELIALREFEAGAGPQGDVHEPRSLLSEIQEIGRNAGLSVGIGRESRQDRGGADITRLTIEYTIQHESLERILDWVQRCTDRIAGLRVNEITVTPQQNRWQVRVTFARWERRQ